MLLLIAAELLRHREWPSLESLCRHYKTCSLDQNPRCLPLMRTRAAMIRLLDWYALTRNAKQLNWPKSVYLHKLVLVNVSSAIVIAVGFLLSTSPTDVLSINTGRGSGTALIGMPWNSLAALLHPAGAPVPIRLFLFGKARELSPLPFLTHNCLLQGMITLNWLHEIHWRCHQRLQFYQVPPVSLTLRLDYSTVSPWQGILFGLFSTEVGATQGGITGAQITFNSALSAFQSSPYRTCLT